MLPLIEFFMGVLAGGILGYLVAIVANSGSVDRCSWCRRTTFDEAKQEFKTRYEEMKRMGVKPFSLRPRRSHGRIAISLVAGSLLPPA
jgi:hypothetical protein